MNDSQILEVHSRWVYNFMGIILEAQTSFSFSHSCILLKNYSQILVILKPYTERRNWHDTALDANECVMNNRFIHCILYVAAQSMQDLAPGMKNSAFLYRFSRSPKSESNFWKECMNVKKMKDACAPKSIPIKLYTQLLCTSKIWLSFMNVVKSY